ncbi:MAG: 50S ribosomal protein L6 [Candidatus Babeliales bacterium]
MSKIGRKPIEVSTAKVEIKGKKIFLKGPKAEFIHELPEEVNVILENGFLTLSISENNRENRMLWGLHRALIANKIIGVQSGFEKNVKIVGLGYKAQLLGKKLTFILGYSHKIDYELPVGVTVDVDKTGQNLIFKSSDKFLLGNVCDIVRSFRPPEPYKGTGIMIEGQVLIRKAGKTKASS